MSADDVLSFGMSRVVLATGSHWRRDGVARFNTLAINVSAQAAVYTPDDILNGERPTGKILIFDDDHYYMGGVLAELLTGHGAQITLVTPAADVSNWTHHTMEQHRIQARLMELGVTIITHKAVTAIEQSSAELTCTMTSRTSSIEFDAVLLVTARVPEKTLHDQMQLRRNEWKKANITLVNIIGDAEAPATIAQAVYADRRYAEELDAPDIGDAVPFQREIAELIPTSSFPVFPA